MKAIGLFSGGLDSILASKIICDAGFDVEAIYFKTLFDGEKKFEDLPENYFFESKNGKFKLKTIDINDKFFEILLNPKFGYGKNLNPCIDCKILFISEALKLRKEKNAEFVFTGEVVGQRPKSQKLKTLNLINNTVESDGYLLRPLSAKLLEETIPEQKGVIDRNLLLDISGRSRKVQLEYAEKYNLKNYGSPAGGCLLTDRSFSIKLKYLIENDLIDEKNIKYLKLGRNFLFKKDYRIIVGRNEIENNLIYENASENDLLLNAVDVPGPTTIILSNSEVNEDAILEASKLTLKYCDKENRKKICIKLSTKQNENIKEIEFSDLENIDISATMFR